MRRIAPQKRHRKIFIQFETQQKIGRRAKLGGGQNQNKLSETRVAGDSNAKKNVECESLRRKGNYIECTPENSALNGSPDHAFQNAGSQAGFFNTLTSM